MSNYPVKYQPQQTQLSHQQGRELTRTQTDLVHIAATTRFAYDAIGAIYETEIATVVRDLTYMNNHIRAAIENGMPPGQVEAVYEETVRYQEYQRVVADIAASAVIERIQK